MFCILEELSFSISESLSALFAAHGIQRGVDSNSSNPSKSSSNPSSNPSVPNSANEENDSDAESPFQGKHDFQMITARVIEVGQAESGFIHVRSDQSDFTSYKWSESVVLLASEKLSKKRRAHIRFSLGVCSLLDTSSAKPEWTVYLSPRAHLALGAEIVLYSLVGFTSFAREFVAVSSLQKSPLRSQWAAQLTQKSPLRAAKLNTTLASHIDPVGFPVSPLRQTLLEALRRQLNVFQLEVVTALSRPGLSGVFLVEGPPGTGKTTTIVSIVQTLVATSPVSLFLLSERQHVRLLIAAPSNAAVDTLLEKLVLSLPSAQTPSVVRLGRVGGDASARDHPERAFLQKYELDGMVDRQIRKFRSDPSNRLATESDGFLRKKFEQSTLMGARVVARFPPPLSSRSFPRWRRRPTRRWRRFCRRARSCRS